MLRLNTARCRESRENGLADRRSNSLPSVAEKWAMRHETERTLAERVKLLGESADPGAPAELAAFCASPSPLVRRLAASALGKLSRVAERAAAVDALLLWLSDARPQTRQDAAQALGTYGAAAEKILPTLRDMMRRLLRSDPHRAAQQGNPDRRREEHPYCGRHVGAVCPGRQKNA